MYSMGTSRIRLSHVMPKLWFYKLRDFGRLRDSQRRFLQAKNSNRDDSAISLPRKSYHFGRDERIHASPVNHKASQQQPKRKTEIRRNGRGKSNKRRSSTFIESTISAGCSCRITAIGSLWNLRDRDEYWSSESSDEEPDVMDCSKQPTSSQQQHQQKKQQKPTYSTPFMQRFDISTLASKLESDSGNWNQPSRHVLQYNYNNVAGLPSPVHDEDADWEYFKQPEQPVQTLVTKVKEIFDFVRDPFVVDTSINCSSSCSCKLSSSSPMTEKELSFNEEQSQEETESPDHYNSLVTRMKGKQRDTQYLEDSTNFRATRRNAELEHGIREKKKKQLSDKTPAPAREKVDSPTKFHSEEKQPSTSSSMNFKRSNAVAIQQPTKPGTSKSQLSIKTDKRKTTYSSMKANDNAKAIAKESPDSQLSIPLKGTPPVQSSRLKVDRQKAIHTTAENLSKCHICSEISSNEFDEPAENTAICDSFAVVKSSYDPHNDFKESMVEMINENDFHSSRDLEQLLQCYLSLNSHEYHHIIVQAFEQVRSDMDRIRS